MPQLLEKNRQKKLKNQKPDNGIDENRTLFFLGLLFIHSAVNKIIAFKKKKTSSSLFSENKDLNKDSRLLCK